MVTKRQDRVETYTLAEFTTGTWSDRPEYSSVCIGFDRIVALHSAESDFVGQFQCGETRFKMFLHSRNEITFEAYLYEVGGWDQHSAPLEAEPVIWLCGTSFDGFRECSGGQNFSSDPLNLAAALVWSHQFFCERWPRFKEWYAYTGVDRQLDAGRVG